ncbi:hypothetical protein [Luteimonas rhizosphaerae]|nr:hypothetical protein [Luteimonas sp. 4-12]
MTLLAPPRTPERRLPASAPDGYAAMAWIEEFVELARCAIEEEDDEVLRRRYEDEVLQRARFLRAAGLFDIVRIAHPALRAMVEDAAR